MQAAGTSRRFAASAACIGAAALVLRLFHLTELRDTPLFAVPIGDGWQYDMWAQRIAGGDWFGSEAFYQSPLYPYFLATIYWTFGHSIETVRTLQAILGAASCVFLALAGRGFFDARAGLAAAAMLAAYPFAIFSDGLIQKSTLDLFLLTALLALLALTKVALETGGQRLLPRTATVLVASGIVLALLTLNRETTRVLYPVIAAWLLVYARGSQPVRARVAAVVLFTLAMALVILPVAIRNYAVSGEFLLSTWQAGPNFYIGNNASAHGYYEPLAPGGGSAEREREDATRLAEAAAGRRLSESEISDYWLSRAFEFIRSQPLAWLRLLGVKTVLTLNAREISDTESPEAYAEFSGVLKTLRWFSFGVLMPIAAAGAWMTRKRWRELAVLYAMFLALALSVVLFFVFARYRYPLVPVAMLLAGAAAAEMLGFLRAGRGAPGARLPAVGIAALVAAFCHVPVATDLAEVTFYNVGVGLMKSGRQAEAIRLLEEAVRRSPDDAAAYFELGGALSAAGDKTRAVQAFESAARLRPDDWQTRMGLALALRDLGRTPEALEHFRHAARLKPDEPMTRRNLGMALLDAGEDAAAVSELQHAVRLRPDDFAAHYAIAQVHARAGRAAETLQALEAALAAAQRAGARDEAARIEEAIRLTRNQMR